MSDKNERWGKKGLLVAVLALFYLVVAWPGADQAAHAAPTGGSIIYYLPAFYPAGTETFHFHFVNDSPSAANGLITVFSGTEKKAANIVGSAPVSVPGNSQSDVAIASISGVPVGHNGFAMVTLSGAVKASVYSAPVNRYHMIAVNPGFFGAEFTAAEGIHAAHQTGGPYEITVQPGDTVSWVNHQNGAKFGFHNIQQDDGVFTNGGPYDEWVIYSYTFTYSDDFPYFCSVHGGPEGQGMAGIVHVGGNVPTPTPTRTPTATPSPGSGSATPTNTPSHTPTHTPTGTLTPTSTPTHTPTGTLTITAQPTLPNSPQGTAVFLPIIGKEE